MDLGAGQSGGCPLRGSADRSSVARAREARTSDRLVSGYPSEDTLPTSRSGIANNARPPQAAGRRATISARKRSRARASSARSRGLRHCLPSCAIACLLSRAATPLRLDPSRGEGGVGVLGGAFQSEREEETRDRAERGSAVRGSDQASVAAERNPHADRPRDEL